MVLTLYGCRSAGDLGTKAHTPPTDVVVNVSLPAGGGTPVPTPDKAVLEHPNQKLIWTSCDGKLDITWDNNANLPPVRCDASRGYCVVTIPRGHRGVYPYTITLTPFAARSAAIMIDPQVIVEY
jgi:hypothetical protein